MNMNMNMKKGTNAKDIHLLWETCFVVNLVWINIVTET